MKPSKPEDQQRMRTLVWGGGVAALLVSALLVGGSIIARQSRATREADLSAPIVLHGPHVSMRPTIGPPPVIAPPVIAPETGPQTALLGRAQQVGSRWASQMQTKEFAPEQSGPGIVVCEPVSASPQGDFAAFGAGCGRWLHLAVGGWGALGKTPTWGSVDDQRRVLARPDMRLSSTDAGHLAQGLGVTHVAVGTLSGTPAQATLAYQIWAVNPLRAMGTPYTVSGTRDQIVAQLPALARKLGSALGAGPMPDFKLATGSAAELTALGSVPWWVSERLPDSRTWEKREAQRKTLSALAPRLPLAGVLLVSMGDTAYAPIWDVVNRSQPQNAPDNVLALAALTFDPGTPIFEGVSTSYNRARAAQVSPLVRASWQRLNARFPHNFALAEVALDLSEAHLTNGTSRRAALHAVACAPESTFGWRRACDAFMDESETVRHSRSINQMSRSDMASVEQIYPLALRSALKAASLTPQNNRNWLDVATAASFDSERKLADAAYWRAWRLNPRDISVLGWGLEMFQPKWHDEPDSLLKVATFIESDRTLLGPLTQNALWALQKASLMNEGNAMLNRTIQLYVFRLKSNPKDAEAHLNLAYLYAKNDNHSGSGLKPQAIAEYKAYLQLRPHDALTHYALASLLSDQNLNAEAETHYRQALALDPTLTESMSELGDLIYASRHDAKTAEQLYRKAIALNTETSAHIGLATVLLDQGKKAEALAHARQAIALGYTDQEAVYTRLGLKPNAKPTSAPTPFHA